MPIGIKPWIFTFLLLLLISGLASCDIGTSNEFSGDRNDIGVSGTSMGQCVFYIPLLLSNDKLSSIQRMSVLKYVLNEVESTNRYPLLNFTTNNMTIQKVNDAVYPLFDALNSTSLIGLISGGTSDVTSFSSQMSTYFSQLVLAFSSTSVDLLSKIIFSNLLVVTNSDDLQVKALKNIISHYGWNQIAVFHTNDLYSCNVFAGLSKEIKNLESRVLLYDIQFNNITQLKEKTDFILEKDFKVVVLWCSYESAMQFFEYLDEKEADPMLLILSDALSQREVFISPTGEIPSYVEKYLEGSIGIVPKIFPTASLESWMAIWESLDPIEYPGAGVHTINLYALYEYDAINIFLTELDEFYTSESLKNITCDEFQQGFTETLFNNIILNHYSGITGDIYFDSDGYRIPVDFDIVNYHNYQFVSVGLINVSSWEVTIETPPTWFDGTTHVPKFAPTFIKIGGLFPTDFIYGTQFAASFNLAVDYINNNAAPLPNTTLLGIVEETNSPTSLVEAMGDLSTEFIWGIIGPFTSDMSLSATFLSTGSNTPLLSYGATLYELTISDLFPSFSRIVPSDEHRMKVIARLILKMGWRRLVILSMQDSYSNSASTILIDSLDKLDIKVSDIKQIFMQDDGVDVLEELMEQIKEDDLHIFVILLPMTDNLRQAMTNVGICVGEYACSFIFCDDITYVDYVWNGTVVSNETLEFIAGSLAVLPMYADNSYESFKEMFQSRNKTLYPVVDDFVCYYSAFVFDAVIAISHVYEALIAESWPFTMENYRAKLLDVDFVGYTGDVKFTRLLERCPSFGVFNVMQDYTIRKVGYTVYSEEGYWDLLDVPITEQIIWRESSTICPSDTSGCSFQDLGYNFAFLFYFVYVFLFAPILLVITLIVLFARKYHAVKLANLGYMLLLQLSFVLMLISNSIYVLFYVFKQSADFFWINEILCASVFWSLYPSHTLALSCLITKAHGILYFAKKRNILLLKSYVRNTQLVYQSTVFFWLVVVCLFVVSLRYDLTFLSVFRFKITGSCYLDCNINGVSYLSQGVSFSMFLTALSLPVLLILFIHVYVLFLFLKLWNKKAEDVFDKEWHSWALANTVVSFGVFIVYSALSTYILAIALKSTTLNIFQQINAAVFLFCNVWMITLNEFFVFFPILRKIWEEYREKRKQKKVEAKTKLQEMSTDLLSNVAPNGDSIGASTSSEKSINKVRRDKRKGKKQFILLEDDEEYTISSEDEIEVSGIGSGDATSESESLGVSVPIVSISSGMDVGSMLDSLKPEGDDVPLLLGEDEVELIEESEH